MDPFARPLRAFALPIAAALALLAAPARAGPPYRTDDPEPVAPGHWEVYVFTALTWTGDDAGGAAPGIEVNYGAARDVQLHLVAPLAVDRSDDGPTAAGLGDIELGAKLRLVHKDERGWRPQVGVFPLVELPTGAAARGLGSGRTRVFLPVWVQKSYGPWLTYGGGGYWINPGPLGRNAWYAGWLVQRQVTRQLALGAEVYWQGADRAGGQDSLGFNLGAVWDLSAHHHLLLSIGRALANARATNRLSLYLGLQTTF
jgi:hypothetical protein